MNIQLSVLFVILVIGQNAKAQSVPAVLLAGAGFFDGGVRHEVALISKQFDSEFRSSTSSTATSTTTSSNSNSNSNNNNALSSSSGSQESDFKEQQEAKLQSSEYPLDGVFEPFNLPSGASLILGDIDTTFSCGDYPYGFYADEKNYCRIFHICVPFLYDDGRIEPIQHSFMCAGETVFDQSQLACLDKAAAMSCLESSYKYSSNEAFGLPQEKL